MDQNEIPGNAGTVLVTGGSGGLGRALVSELGNQGYKVINWDLTPPDQVQSHETFLKIDLTSVIELDQACGILKANFRSGASSSRLIGFVHSAGYGGPYHKITEVSLEEWDRIFSINLRSAFQITKSLLSIFTENSFGRLVYIASSLSVQGSALSVAYSSSKHGIIGFMKSIAAEWGEKGITSNAISPGYMETKMGIQEDQVNDHRKKIIEMTPVKKIASPEEIARVVSFLISSGSGYINGANWTVDGGITSI
ncbi:SDR family NAD(P)-dependent oxidoreductase [Leptospira sarikeiensis]|uniref:SDR family oxidoreductase n=1 Tax=Leptospira sarikeiensis TaxID=2484943 RepID=A0A4R9K127_9LEPT|nr:SDR family oxidoreductase [Leptospira sarikeiensis]TGL58831.1 SDR family oxidoreductase [Leptospira sarikeiensis]